jgi:hypothetical protein
MRESAGAFKKSIKNAGKIRRVDNYGQIVCTYAIIRIHTPHPAERPGEVLVYENSIIY